MSEKHRIVYYVNQFFGQVGGEEQADIKPFFKEESVGPAMGFEALVKDYAEVKGTIICGDNYFNQNKEEALEVIMRFVKEQDADILVAGPAFNAGRYGMACGGIGKEVAQKLNIPVVTGMYIENPGVDECKKDVYILSTTDSAAGMRKALPGMAALTKKLLLGEEIRTPEEEGYIPQGIRKTVFADKRGSMRAVEMLLTRLKGDAYVTELPMAIFDRVEPAPAIKSLGTANIALVSSGGIVPKGNPDRIESASATKFGKYDIDGVQSLTPDKYETIHGGYDPIYANKDPNRVVPLDVLRDIEREGIIGKIHQYYYATTGTGTSVANAVMFGKEIGKELHEAGVDGVLLVST